MLTLEAVKDEIMIMISANNDGIDCFAMWLRFKGVSHDQFHKALKALEEAEEIEKNVNEMETFWRLKRR